MTLRPSFPPAFHAAAAPRHGGRAAVLALLCAAALGGGLAHAEKADQTKPMNIEADALRYDDLRQTSVFTGRVVVTKGTIVIRGSQIDVRQDPEGYQYGVVTAPPGQLAYFKQKRDGNGDEWIEGQSDRIEYDSRSDTVKFVGNAVMRRLVGTKVNDETTGPLIVYDQSNDTFSVNGGQATPGTTTQPGGRVRAVLGPRQAPAAPGSAPATPGSAPATKAPAPGAPGGLRPSTTLGGDQRQ